MLFVVLTGAAVAISPLSLAMVLPLPAVCVASFGLGVFVEMMMVQWTVALARNLVPNCGASTVRRYAEQVLTRKPVTPLTRPSGRTRRPR